MKREHLQNDVISFNTRLTNWLDKIEENTKKIITKKHGDEIVVVDDDIDAMQLEQQSKKSKIGENSKCLHLPIEHSYENEVMWINEVSRRSQVNFGSEEIVPGDEKFL